MKPRIIRKLAAVTLVTALAMTSVACTTSNPQATVKPTPAADLTSFTGQELTWEPCASYARTDGDAKAFLSDRYECSYLDVPLDYADPAGRQAQLGVLRLPATGKKIGSLVLNPGGPGASGMSFAAIVDSTLAKNSPIREKFDLIGLDPRGVAASSPSIDCFSDAERDANGSSVAFSVLSGSKEWTSAKTEALPKQCAERSGGVDVIEHMGTYESVRDLDVLRAVLKDPKLTYLGISYGTRLGAVYAQTFPDRVRALVLDAAMDPTLTTAQRLASEFGGFQGVFGELATYCATNGAECPLGTDPEQATARFQQMTRPLIDHPVPTASGRTLDFEGAMLGTIAALYNPASWDVVIKGMAQLQAGHGDILLALNDSYQQRNADGSYGNENEALLVYNCLDEQRQTPAQETAMKKSTIAAAPITDAGRPFTSRNACEHWPVEPTIDIPNNQTPAGLPTTLEVSVTQDPATPYEAGVNLAKVLDGHLFTVDGIQHGAALISGSACVDEAVENYLIDLKTPPTDQTCSLLN